MCIFRAIEAIVYVFPNAPSSRAIKKLAASMIGEDYRALVPESFGEMMMRFLGMGE